VTHPYDPDAPRTEEPPVSRDDNEAPHEGPPASPTDSEATPSEVERQRPIYERYDPGPRQEPPPSDTEPPTYDPRPWDSMDDVAWPRRPETEPPPPRREEYHGWNPLIRLGVPQPWRGIIDWIVTIVGAIAIVFAIKAWVVNPYRIPSSSMEPTLHCARNGGSGCLARFSDRVLANRFIYHFRDPRRGEIIVFDVPKAAEAACGAGGVFVKRIVGLPGDVWQEREGYVYINGKKLNEPYVKKDRRDLNSWPARKIPKDNYFMMGDNRTSSCDSRRWGTVPRENIIGKVFAIYWPPLRINIM
jgi:signal peptidase I